jgi:rhodanese-related sulfurtransferase/predicted transcriptional regulator
MMDRLSIDKYSTILLNMEAHPSIPTPSAQASALPSGLKPALFEQFARLGRALSHGQRLELLELLAQCEHPVDALARTMNLPVANVSQHLQQLKQAGLVRARRDGRSVIYRVAGPDVVALLAQLQQVAEGTLTEVTRLVQQLDDRDSVLPVPLEEVLRQARDGLVTLIDVRPPHEFAAAHLPGAVNLPLDALAQRLGELPPGREVLAYCRGPYCVMAVEAVARLREAGIPARRIAGGLPHWRLEGASLDGTQPGFAAHSGLTHPSDDD